MSALTTYLASAECREEVTRWHERWGDDEQWREDADAALNALCEQLRERDGQHEVQLMRADNLMTQRDEAERKWRHAEGERNALCKRIRELEAEMRQALKCPNTGVQCASRADDECCNWGAGYVKEMAKLEAENERLRERAHVDCDEYVYLAVDGMCHKGGNGPLCPNEPRCHLIDEHKRARVAELEEENARLKVCGSCARLVHGSRPVCRRPKYNYCPGEWMWEHVHLDDVCHFDESRWTPYWADGQEARP